MKITASIAWTVAVALICIIGCMTVIVVSGHDVTIFVVAIGILLTSATGFITVFQNQKRQGEVIETVKRQTNGTLTKLLAEKASAEMKLRAALARVPQDEAEDILSHTLTRDELHRLLAEDNADVTGKA